MWRDEKRNGWSVLFEPSARARSTANGSASTDSVIPFLVVFSRKIAGAGILFERFGRGSELSARGCPVSRRQSSSLPLRNASGLTATMRRTVGWVWTPL